MMKINEQLPDVKLDEGPGKTIQPSSVTAQLSIEIYEPVKKIVEQYMESITTEKRAAAGKRILF